MTRWLINGLQYLLYATIVLLLLKGFGVWTGLAIYLSIVTVGSLLAWQLLESSETGKATWKNFVAGWLLPWTLLVGGGSLPALLIKNALASAVFGIAVAVCWKLNLLESGVPADAQVEGTGSWLSAGMVWLTAAGWLTLLIGWLWLLKSTFSHRTEPISTLILHKRMTVPLLVPPVVLLASIGLRYYGLDGFAFLAVWIPLGMILMPVFLMAFVLIVHTLAGKPIRWN